jgi:magnesium-transporting ATPase (P-type)
LNTAEGDLKQIILPGVALALMLKNEQIKTDLIEFLKDAKSVILYRSSPSQKSKVVELMKKNTNGKRTLAIGDGANDVTMILEAHVGIGLMGKEGN